MGPGPHQSHGHSDSPVPLRDVSRRDVENQDGFGGGIYAEERGQGDASAAYDEDGCHAEDFDGDGGEDSELAWDEEIVAGAHIDFFEMFFEPRTAFDKIIQKKVEFHTGRAVVRKRIMRRKEAITEMTEAVSLCEDLGPHVRALVYFELAKLMIWASDFEATPDRASAYFKDATGYLEDSYLLLLHHAIEKKTGKPNRVAMAPSKKTQAKAWVPLAGTVGMPKSSKPAAMRTQRTATLRSFFRAATFSEKARHSVRKKSVSLMQKASMVDSAASPKSQRFAKQESGQSSGVFGRAAMYREESAGSPHSSPRDASGHFGLGQTSTSITLTPPSQRPLQPAMGGSTSPVGGEESPVSKPHEGGAPSPRFVLPPDAPASPSAKFVQSDGDTASPHAARRASIRKASIRRRSRVGEVFSNRSAVIGRMLSISAPAPSQAERTRAVSKAGVACRLRALWDTLWARQDVAARDEFLIHQLLLVREYLAEIYTKEMRDHPRNTALFAHFALKAKKTRTDCIEQFKALSPPGEDGISEGLARQYKALGDLSLYLYEFDAARNAYTQASRYQFGLNNLPQGVELLLQSKLHEASEELATQRAAVRIQAYFRAWQDRKYVEVMRMERAQEKDLTPFQIAMRRRMLAFCKQCGEYQGGTFCAGCGIRLSNR